MRHVLGVVLFFALTSGLAGIYFEKDAQESQPMRYEANWESLDSRPMPQWYLDAKFGILVHWGLYSVPAFSPKGLYAEWYWHGLSGDPEKMNKRQKRRYIGTVEFHNRVYGSDFKYEQFAPMFKAEFFDPYEWAEIFAESGAKYIILTSKHHEGFCLWPNKEANRTWGRPWNSVDIGPKRDLVGDLTRVVRHQGLKMGYYYSMYEWFNPLWLEDRERFVTEHMLPQFKDLVTRYEPSIIYSDGEWDMPPEKWKSQEFLAWLFNDSSCRDEVVINDRWGDWARHRHGGYYTTEVAAGLKDSSHPWEETQPIGHSFGYNRNEDLGELKTGKELVLTLVDTVSRGGNFLLDVGPTADGRIPVIQQDRLKQIGDWLKVNSEAIYGTRAWRHSCQWTEGKKPEQKYGRFFVEYHILENVGIRPKNGIAVKQVFFTSKAEILYAIVPAWPGDELELRDVAASDNVLITLLGVPDELKWQAVDGGIRIKMPNLNVDEMPCRHAYVLKLVGVQ